ncbi:MAG TPA: hypothetical protein EYG50_01670 [Cycloclasticus sp.]|jgi:predicted DNA-binding protein|nr:hypothetical protein [Cycloclasticus sp.]HIL91453.1 hypothetical protein [Cycloclasticus sp.]
MALFNFLQKNTAPKSSLQGDDNDEAPAPEYIISTTGRHYDGLDNNDIAIKIWLPEVLSLALDEMASYTSSSKSDLLRQTFFSYLYGRYDLMGLIERGDHRFALNPPPMFSRQAKEPSEASQIINRTPELGKNTEDVKVWIPGQIKSDLQTLADESGYTLSHFIREVLISTLFGRTYLSEPEKLESFKISFVEYET